MCFNKKLLSDENFKRLRRKIITNALLIKSTPASVSFLTPKVYLLIMSNSYIPKKVLYFWSIGSSNRNSKNRIYKKFFGSKKKYTKKRQKKMKIFKSRYLDEKRKITRRLMWIFLSIYSRTIQPTGFVPFGFQQDGL